MVKRRGKNQIENLILDHKPLESKGQMSSNWGVLYTFGKIFLRDISYCPRIFLLVSFLGFYCYVAHFHLIAFDAFNALAFSLSE
jgi:hypothetical protein